MTQRWVDLRFEHEGAVTGTQRHVPEGETIAMPDVVLARSCHYAGVVRDPRGDPVPGVIVSRSRVWKLEERWKELESSGECVEGSKALVR